MPAGTRYGKIGPGIDPTGSDALRGGRMGIDCRAYDQKRDYGAVGEFLVRTYGAIVHGSHRNWLQPRWEYMHYHPAILDRHQELARCAVWCEGETIVAAIHFEDRMGVVYVELDPAYPHLRREILERAIERLAGDFKDGRAVHVYLDDEDGAFQEAATAMGFVRLPGKHAEIMMALRAEALPAETRSPEGFEIIGLDQDDDLRKVHRVMHRGFDHSGEAPEDELDARRRKLSAPNLRKDLTAVARAPSGEFVSFCGMWMDTVNRVAYVEPVATDPEYRRRGLGTAVVLEGVRRCAREGAALAYVGSDQPFYLSMGFEPCYRHSLWRKSLGSA